MEVTNSCKFFGQCGGCRYLDISYADELALKRAALLEVFGEFSGLVDEIIPAIKPMEYRNKMELAFGDEGRDGRLALGMRKQRSFYEVATPMDCVLICADFKKIILYVLQYFRESGETFYHRKRHTGALRHLVLRRGEATGEMLVLLSTASSLQTPLEPMIEGLQDLKLDGKIVGILHSVNDGVADAVKADDVRLLWGRDFYFDELVIGAVTPLRFKISMFSFFQTNTKGAEVLYSVVKEAAGMGKHALDLYCGTGTITQIISPLFEQVTGVEIVDAAIAVAKKNAELNGIKNCNFIAGDATKVLSELTAKDSPKKRLDLIIVDPPRDGLSPKALSYVTSFCAKKIIYVACKPKSLARDLPQLISAGYTPQKITPVDMFPRTPHIECVCLLAK